MLLICRSRLSIRGRYDFPSSTIAESLLSLFELNRARASDCFACTLSGCSSCPQAKHLQSSAWMPWKGSSFTFCHSSRSLLCSALNNSIFLLSSSISVEELAFALLRRSISFLAASIVDCFSFIWLLNAWRPLNSMSEILVFNSFIFESRCCLTA